MNPLKNFSINNKSIFTLILLICVIFFTASCTVSDQIEQAQLESVKDKSLDEQIKTYFNLLSNVSNSDVGGSFELSHSQATALNNLERVKDKKYLPMFMDALDNDSPVIRQAAIHQMESHKYKPAIPKLISIMNNDSVRQIQFDAMETLTTLSAVQACNDVVLIAQNNRKTQTIKRALTALVDIPCPQAKPLLLDYFKTGAIHTINPKLRYAILTVVSRTKSNLFVPYLIELTQPLKQANASKEVIQSLDSGPWVIEIEALQKLGGSKVEAFFHNELSGSYNSEYKRKVVQYLLKMDTPKTDTMVMDYIDQVSDFKARELIYYSLKNAFHDIERRQPFVDRLITNYENESNEKIKDKIIFMLIGITKEKHINKLKLFLDKEKSEGDKCNILLALSTIPSKKHYQYMIKFDNENELSWCQVAASRYKKLIKSVKK